MKRITIPMWKRNPDKSPSAPYNIPDGTLSADVDIAIDADRLLDDMAATAMRSQSCKSTKAGGAIVVRASNFERKGAT